MSPLLSASSSSSLSLSSSSPQQSAAAVREENFALSTGVSMQVMSRVPANWRPKNGKHRPVLLFLHGSFHAAWCWAENYFDYFYSRGYPVVALSWRGTGGTFAGEGVTKIKIMEHVADLQAVLQDVLPSIVGSSPTREEDVVKPVVICHSFGGLALMKYLELQPEQASTLSGAIVACSVPPSGLAKMTWRFLRRSLKDSWTITAGFAMKRCVTDASLCRRLFFGGDKVPLDDNGTVDDFGISDQDVARYQGYFERDSAATINLFDLSKILPSKRVDDEGRAPYAGQFPPCLVLGAVNDGIVDTEGVEETARYFGLKEPLLVDSPHDIMLGRNWQNAANAMEQWLEETFPAK